MTNKTTGTKGLTKARFRYGKRGLAEDPRGHQVALEWQGRTLLGDVVGVSRDFVTGACLLDVRHFNGETWPLRPVANRVEVLSLGRAAEPRVSALPPSTEDGARSGDTIRGRQP